MKGKVCTWERCPLCGKQFQKAAAGGRDELICPDHQTRPRRYYIDARALGAGKIYKNKMGRAFDSYLGASRQLEEMRAQYDRHQFDSSQWIPSRLREYKVKHEAERWIERTRKERSFSHWEGAKNVMRNHFIPVHGEMDVRDVRRHHLEDFKTKLERKRLAPATIKTYLDYIGAFFSWLKEMEIIEKSPGRPSVMVPDRERGWIHRESQEMILSRIAPRHRPIIETIIETGCRPGEICALRCKDVLNGYLVIDKAIDARGKIKGTKTGKRQYKRISDSLFSRLNTISIARRFPLSHLFINRQGLPYRTKGLWDIWNTAAKAVGIDVSLYNGTRHSLVSQMKEIYEREMETKLSAELGHASPAITMQRYARSRHEAVDRTRPQGDLMPRNSL